MSTIPLKHLLNMMPNYQKFVSEMHLMLIVSECQLKQAHHSMCDS